MGVECRDCSCGSVASIAMVWGALSIAEIIFASRKLSCGSDDGIDDDGRCLCVVPPHSGG